MKRKFNFHFENLFETPEYTKDKFKMGKVLMSRSGKSWVLKATGPQETSEVPPTTNVAQPTPTLPSGQPERLSTDFQAKGIFFWNIFGK